MQMRAWLDIPRCLPFARSRLPAHSKDFMQMHYAERVYSRHERKKAAEKQTERSALRNKLSRFAHGAPLKLLLRSQLSSSISRRRQCSQRLHLGVYCLEVGPLLQWSYGFIELALLEFVVPENKQPGRIVSVLIVTRSAESWGSLQRSN